MVVSEVVIHHKARFNVAVPITTDVTGECLDIVQAYSDSIPSLGIPTLEHVIPGLVEVALVSWEEARYSKKVIDSWVKIGAGRISLSELFYCQPIPHDPKITYNRDEHFKQLELGLPT